GPADGAVDGNFAGLRGQDTEHFLQEHRPMLARRRAALAADLLARFESFSPHGVSGCDWPRFSCWYYRALAGKHKLSGLPRQPFPVGHSRRDNMMARSVRLRRGCHAGLVVLLWLFCVAVSFAEEKPLVGLIPKAQKPITLDGKLEEWQGAFVTPVHV